MDRLRYIIPAMYDILNQFPEELIQGMGLLERSLEPDQLFMVDELIRCAAEENYEILDDGFFSIKLGKKLNSNNTNPVIEDLLYHIYLIYQSIPDDNFVFGNMKDTVLGVLLSGVLMYCLSDDVKDEQLKEALYESWGTFYHLDASTIMKGFFSGKKKFLENLKRIKEKS